MDNEKIKLEERVLAIEQSIGMFHEWSVAIMNHVEEISKYIEQMNELQETAVGLQKEVSEQIDNIVKEEDNEADWWKK